MTSPEYMGKEAEWNSAVESSKRLSFWIQQSNVNYYDEEYIDMKKCLFIVYAEIFPKLSKDEKNKLKKMKDEIHDEMPEFEKQFRAFKESMEGQVVIKSNIPELLFKFSLKLREFADRHNLLIPDKKSIYDMEE